MLRIGDRLAAAQLAIEQAGAYWLLLSGSDPRFAQLRVRRYCWRARRLVMLPRQG